MRRSITMYDNYAFKRMIIGIERSWYDARCSMLSDITTMPGIAYGDWWMHDKRTSAMSSNINTISVCFVLKDAISNVMLNCISSVFDLLWATEMEFINDKVLNSYLFSQRRCTQELRKFLKCVSLLRSPSQTSGSLSFWLRMRTSSRQLTKQCKSCKHLLLEPNVG